MTEELMKLVFRFRFLIYGVGIICAILAYSESVSSRPFPPLDIKEMVSFWPPDLIPHPLPPWERPVDPDELPPMALMNIYT